MSESGRIHADIWPNRRGLRVDVLPKSDKLRFINLSLSPSPNEKNHSFLYITEMRDGIWPSYASPTLREIGMLFQGVINSLLKR